MAEAPQLPVSESDRIRALDIIRGAALLGVIWMNLEGYFRGTFARFQLDPHPWPGLLNHLADATLQPLLAWKAMSLYAFLFGVGIAIQFARGRENASAFRCFAFRRMAALLVIGALHVTFVFGQDILMPYAVCGLLAALFYSRLNPRSLVLLGCGWIVVALAVLLWLSSSMPPPEEVAEMVGSAVQQSIDDNLRTGWWASVGLRWTRFGEGYLGFLLQGVLYAHGLMLLGMAAWRAGVFADPERWRSRARLVTLSVLPTALLVVMLIWLIPDLQGRRFNLQPPWANALFFGCTPLLALGYAAGLWCLANDSTWRYRLAPVAAIGRMGLTNYLLHSLVLSWVFYGYGLGLFDRFGAFVGTVVIGLALFMMMAWWSPWWLERFRFGPAEWLWRWMTYGKRQTFRLRTPKVPAVRFPQEPTAPKAF